jgi:CSLREA domain-containing protein
VPNLTDGTDIGAYEAPADPIQGDSANIIVLTNADHDDGVCGTSDCTLREAIARTNAVPGPNTITFAPAFPATITLLPSAGGQLNITEGVTIVGPGARSLKISAGTQTRVFFVSGAGTTMLSGLTIADGWMANSNAGDAEGAGIFNQAVLSLVDCTLDFNRAIGGFGFVSGQSGGNGRGGAIFNGGALTLERCTVKNSSAFGGNGADNTGAHTTGGAGGDGLGGGVYNHTGASLTLINCTFAGNGVAGGNGGDGGFGGSGGDGLGAAVFNLGTLDITASTFATNGAAGGTGGTGVRPGNNGAPGLGAGSLASIGGASSTMRNSISAGNDVNRPAGHDVYGSFTSGGFNLIGKVDGSTGFNAPTDLVGTAATPLVAQLSSLGNNGGPTDTMAPLSGSPVIDQGNSFGLTSDQRGSPRPIDLPATPNANGGDGSDIGAFELSPLTLVSVVSRKMHDGVGEFDVVFPGVESRGTGGMHTIFFTFSNPLASVGGISVTGNPGVTSSSGIGSDPHQYVVQLGSVPNVQQLTITLTNVADQFGGTTSSVPATIGFLLGDTNGNGTVNASDVAQTKSRSGQTVNAANFRGDVTVNGSINASDVSLVKSRSGTALP